MYVCISFCTTLLLQLVRSVWACTKHTAVTSQLPAHYKTTCSLVYFILHTKRACILVCFKLVANCPRELVAKCLCNLASFIKSIWHLASPSYDSKVSIYTLNYWCTWLTMLAMSLWAWLRQCFAYAHNVRKVSCAVYRRCRNLFQNWGGCGVTCMEKTYIAIHCVSGNWGALTPLFFISTWQYLYNITHMCKYV